MKNTIFLLMALFLIATGCRKEIGKITISEADRTFVPYKGTETLHFATQSGRKITFKSGGRKTETYQQNTTNKEATKYFTVEADETTFTTDSLSQLRLVFRLNGSFRNGTTDEFDTGTTFSIYFDDSNMQQDMFAINGFLSEKDATCADANQAQTMQCNQTIEIKGTTYNNVYHFKTTFPEGAYFATETWYSAQHGLLAFTDKKGERFVKQ